MTDTDEAAVERMARAIPMILFCPACGLQHIDQAEPECGWDNPPHRSHLCRGCGHIWRPADMATTGVENINTAGSSDSPAIRGQALCAGPLPRAVLRRAVEEMRQPSAEVIAAGRTEIKPDHLPADDGDAAQCWRAMIDARLAELACEEAAMSRDDPHDNFPDDEDWSTDDENPGAECGRWSNGRLTKWCALAGTEFCDFECPYRD